MAATQANAYADAGYQWVETYTFTQTQGGPPIDLTGLVFEFVIRPDVKNTSSPALVQVSSSGSNSQGSISIPTPTNGIVTVTLTPAATTLLGQGSRPYTLLSGAGTSTASSWVTGSFTSRLVAIG